MINIKVPPMLIFLSSRLLSAFGVVALNYYVYLVYDSESAAYFVLEFILLGLLSIMFCGGINVEALRDDRIKKGNLRRLRSYTYFLIVNCILGLLLLLISDSIFNFELSLLVYSFPLQSVVIFFSSVMVSGKKFLIGGATEQGMISFFVFIILLIFGLNYEKIGIIYLFISIFLIIIQYYSICKFKPILCLISPTRFINLYIVIFKKNIRLLLISIYSYLNIWMIAFVLSVEEKLLLDYNIATRLINIFSFLIATINSYFIVGNSYLNKPDRLDYGYDTILSKREVSRLIVLFLCMFMLSISFFREDIYLLFEVDILLLAIKLLTVCSFLWFGPFGSLLISAGYQKINHDVNLSILMLQLILCSFIYLSNSSNINLLMFAVFIFHLFLSFKDYLYQLCVKRIIMQ